MNSTFAITRQSSAWPAGALCRWATLLVVLGCSPAAPGSKTADASRPDTRGAPPRQLAPLPAGPCGFEPYLETPCAGAEWAQFAVVLGERRFEDAYEPAEAEPLEELDAVLAQAQHLGLEPGYPFAISYDDLLTVDGRRGIGVVGALFAERGAAEAYATAHAPQAEIVGLRAGEHGGMWHCRKVSKDSCAPYITAVQTVDATAAWSWQDLEEVEDRLQQGVWKSPRAHAAQRERVLKEFVPKCQLDAGRIFSTEGRYGWMYAPVRCESGKAGVPVQVTRVNSVVTRSSAGAWIHQIVGMECDTPVMETRPLDQPADVVKFASGRCD